MTDERQSFGIDLATRIDRTCDAFEAAWTAGTLPRLESYLSAVEEEHREAYLRALLPLEIELRAGIGEDADVTEYQQRFPDLADVVGEIFANTPPDDSLAAQATIPPPDVTGTATTADTAPVGNTRIPKQFGRYRLIRKLGQGAMGAVFLAQDEQLNRRVALKVPHRDALTAETRARFQREAQAAAGLRHPGICSIYDIGEIDGHQYISMEYIEGVSLARFAVAESGLNERQIATMVIKMARALQEAHVAGIVHRDLKPANVMIDRKGNPVIMDFGLARQIKQSGDERLTQTGMAVGSPAYMSPEQVEGRSDLIGPASDVYSLGVMLFELLTGDIPFKGSVGSVMGQILNDEPPKPSEYRPDLSVRLENACLKMMAKKVTSRIASMKDVDEALTEFVTRVAARETTGAKETSAATAKTAAELAEGRRGQIKDLIRAGHYKTAIERLEVMAADDREELAEFASWAAGRLPGVKAEREQVRSERQHLFDTARDLMRRHDYAQAAGMLEEYPPDLRTPKMQELLEEAQDLSEEVDGLQHDITKFENRNQRDELLAAVRRLLELKPAHKRAGRLLDELTRKRTGPLTKILGRRAPKFVAEMGIWREWLSLSAIVFVLAFVPMHLAMKQYLEDPRPPAPSPQPVPAPPPAPAGNYALEFVRYNSSVSVPALDSFSGGELTLETWVRLPTHAPGRHCLMSWGQTKKNQNGDNEYAGLYFGVRRPVDGPPEWYLSVNEMEYEAATRSGVPAVVNDWVHVAVVLRGKVAQLFVNGRRAHEVASASLIGVAGQPLHIGDAHALQEDGTPLWLHDLTATLDEIRVSNVARYSGDFTPEVRFEPDADTLALFHCDEGSGGQLTDSSGNIHHGQIRLTLWVSTDDREKSLPNPQATHTETDDLATDDEANGADSDAPDQTTTLEPDEPEVRPGQIVTNGLGGRDLLQCSLPGGWAKSAGFCHITSKSQYREHTLSASNYVADIELKINHRDSNLTIKFGEVSKAVEISLVGSKSAPDPSKPIRCRLYRIQPFGVNWSGPDRWLPLKRWMKLRLIVNGPRKALFQNGRRIWTNHGEIVDCAPAMHSRSDKTDCEIRSFSLRPLNNDLPEMQELRWTVAPDVLDPDKRDRVPFLKTVADKLSSQPEEDQDFAVKSPQIPMIWVKPVRRLLLGNPEARYKELGKGHEPISISHGYWMAAFELTQGQWRDVMGTNPSRFRGSEYLPVNWISYEDAAEFCRRLTTREKRARRLPDGYVYRLPTESEWENACRAGSDANFSISESSVVSASNKADSIVEVGSSPANPWGFHEMHGNVAEWCMDEWTSYRLKERPTGVAYRSNRFVKGDVEKDQFVLRGGAFWRSNAGCTSYVRDRAYAVRGGYRGMRIALARKLK